VSGGELDFFIFGNKSGLEQDLDLIGHFGIVGCNRSALVNVTFPNIVRNTP
jgi:hypothetical protein